MFMLKLCHCTDQLKITENYKSLKDSRIFQKLKLTHQVVTKDSKEIHFCFKLCQCVDEQTMQ